MNNTNRPLWYGKRYPSWDDLLDFADSMGCLVGVADISDQAIYVAGEGLEPPAIIIPPERGLLGFWLLAHELAHLVMHSGPKNHLTFRRDEERAHRWAACALIPESRINHHANASIDAMIAALSAHYEDIPIGLCRLRKLAASIAKYRLKSLMEAI